MKQEEFSVTVIKLINNYSSNTVEVKSLLCFDNYISSVGSSLLCLLSLQSCFNNLLSENFFPFSVW